MKKILLLLIISFFFTAKAQNRLNSYKYVIIPAQFDFQKSQNQFGLNMLLKYKFQQLGFITYLDNEDVPKALLGDKCSVLTPIITDESKMFSRNVFVEVKNCYNDILFVTKIGSSRTKDYNKAYNEALRDALKSFGKYRLNYNSKNEPEEINVVRLENSNKTIKTNNSLSHKEQEVVSPIKNKTTKSITDFLAKQNTNGLILLDAVSKEPVYTIRATSLPNTYLILGINGVIYKKGNFWYRELLINDDLVLEKITIKF